MSRHGKRADGVTQVSVVMDAETKAALAQMAQNEKRTLSNFIAFELERVVASRTSAARTIGIAAESSTPAHDAPVMLPAKATQPYPARQRRKKAQGE